MSATPTSADFDSPALTDPLAELMDGKAPGAWARSGVCTTDSRLSPTDFYLEGRFPKNSKEYVKAKARAKTACNSCPVRVQCLEYAMENRIIHGIWGGTTGPERSEMLYPRSAP